MISISDFCEQHKACQDVREWAIANCSDMADAWQRLDPEWLIWVATRPGVLTDQELRSFAVFCARQVEHLTADQRSKDAINTAEKFAKGKATREELAAACDAARHAARATAWAAAWAAACDAACDAARYAARATAWAAAADADAAADAACDAAWDAGLAAARAAQSDWLRANTQPRFGVEVQS